MAHNKHPKTKTPSDADLKRNPGIGTSKGRINQGDETALDGENTSIGDVENDRNAAGRIDPRQKIRTNK